MNTEAKNRDVNTKTKNTEMNTQAMNKHINTEVKNRDVKTETKIRDVNTQAKNGGVTAETTDIDSVNENVNTLTPVSHKIEENVNSEEPSKAKVKEIQPASDCPMELKAQGDGRHGYILSTLSQFIDSLPDKVYDGQLPAFLQTGFRWQQKVDEVTKRVCARFPVCFVANLNFIQEDEVKLEVIDGKPVVIGVGVLGSVFRARGMDGRQLAMKFLKRLDYGDRHELDVILQEAAVQERLNRVGIAPQLEGFAFVEPNDEYFDTVIVSSYICAKRDSLKSLTMKTLVKEAKARRKNGNVPLLLSHQYEKLLLNLVAEMVKLSKTCVIHTDIKFDNILLRISDDGKEVHSCIIDFGSSFFRRSLKSPRFNFKTLQEREIFLRKYPQYAPELLCDVKRTNYKADVYSFGIILQEIGKLLEIPALGIVACNMRRRNTSDRPDWFSVALSIQVAFGSKQPRIRQRSNKQHSTEHKATVHSRKTSDHDTRYVNTPAETPFFKRPLQFLTNRKGKTSHQSQILQRANVNSDVKRIPNSTLHGIPSTSGCGNVASMQHHQSALNHPTPCKSIYTMQTTLQDKPNDISAINRSRHSGRTQSQMHLSTFVLVDKIPVSYTFASEKSNEDMGDEKRKARKKWFPPISSLFLSRRNRRHQNEVTNRKQLRGQPPGP